MNLRSWEQSNQHTIYLDFWLMGLECNYYTSGEESPLSLQLYYTVSVDTYEPAFNQLVCELSASSWSTIGAWILPKLPREMSKCSGG